MDEHEENPEALERYWDPDLEVLGELLDQLEEDGAMDLEELDGFFAALHCCPELVPPSEYLPVILGDGLENAEVFANEDAAKLFRSEEHTSELQSHLNLVCRLLLEKKNK